MKKPFMLIFSFIVLTAFTNLNTWNIIKLNDIISVEMPSIPKDVKSKKGRIKKSCKISDSSSIDVLVVDYSKTSGGIAAGFFSDLDANDMYLLFESVFKSKGLSVEKINTGNYMHLPYCEFKLQEPAKTNKITYSRIVNTGKSLITLNYQSTSSKFDSTVKEKFFNSLIVKKTNFNQ